MVGLDLPPPYYAVSLRIDFFSGIREGLAMPREPALLGHRSAGSGLVGEAMDGEVTCPP